MTSTTDTWRTAMRNSQGAPAAQRQPSTLLPAARRVDWRFLLPDPVLGDVTAIEPLAQSLVDSLQIFSNSLAILSRSNDREPREAADVVVACDPSRAVLHQAAALMKPGGAVYFESHGLAYSVKRLRRPGSGVGGGHTNLWRPATYAPLLRSLGFADIQAHWHYPNFEGCKMIIPLDDTAPARLALDRGGRSLQARLRTVLGRLLVGSRLLPLVVPCFSIVARWKTSP